MKEILQTQPEDKIFLDANPPLDHYQTYFAIWSDHIEQLVFRNGRFYWRPPCSVMGPHEQEHGYPTIEVAISAVIQNKKPVRVFTFTQPEISRKLRESMLYDTQPSPQENRQVVSQRL